MKKNYIMILLIAVSSFSSWAQTAKQMKSPTPTQYSQFGRSVVNKNEYTLVGAPGEGQGAAYMFQNGNYVAKYTFDKAGDDNSALGTSVGLNSNWYGVGIPYRNFVESLGETGFAILGRRNQTSGLNYYLFPSDLQANDQFGFSMTMSENWIAVGAPGHNNGKGAVYLWKQWSSNGSSGWNEMAKITIPNMPSGASFGLSVSMFEQNGSSDRLIVGAPYYNATGRIYVFKRSGDTWNLELEYTPSNLTSNAQFGYSVDITNNHLIAGAPRANNTGMATILKYENNIWSVKNTFNGFTNTSWFGNSVAIQYNRAAVGAPFQGTTGELHMYTDEGGYKHKGTFYNGQTSQELLGFSVDIESDWVVTGALFTPFNNIIAGAAYRMEFWRVFQSGSWRYAAESTFETTSEHLYPNPSTGGKVNHQINGIQKVIATNIMGVSTELMFNDHAVDVQDLNPGLYSIQITTESGTQVHKLTIQ